MLNSPIFPSAALLKTDDLSQFSMSTLNKETAAQNIGRLVWIHNHIPFVSWKSEQFLSDNIGKRVFHKKWFLSVGVTNFKNEFVAFLLAYWRQKEERNPFTSIYIHRIAIDPNIQHRGLGRLMLSTYVSNAFMALSELNQITLQTNNTTENQWVINFYESLGFVRHSIVQYPEKDDWLMVLTRAKGSETVTRNHNMW